MFKSESNRIHAKGIKVFFIQNEYVHGLLYTNNIPSSNHKDSLYISHSWRDVSSSAISILKHLLLQQICCGVDSQILFLNRKKANSKSMINIIIQIIVFDDTFMLTNQQI